MRHFLEVDDLEAAEPAVREPLAERRDVRDQLVLQAVAPARSRVTRVFCW